MAYPMTNNRCGLYDKATGDYYIQNILDIKTICISK